MNGSSRSNSGSVGGCVDFNTVLCVKSIMRFLGWLFSFAQNGFNRNVGGSVGFNTMFCVIGLCHFFVGCLSWPNRVLVVMFVVVLVSTQCCE